MVQRIVNLHQRWAFVTAKFTTPPRSILNVHFLVVVPVCTRYPLKFTFVLVWHIMYARSFRTRYACYAERVILDSGNCGLRVYKLFIMSRNKPERSFKAIFYLLLYSLTQGNYNPLLRSIRFYAHNKRNACAS